MPTVVYAAVDWGTSQTLYIYFLHSHGPKYQQWRGELSTVNVYTCEDIVLFNLCAFLIYSVFNIFNVELVNNIQRPTHFLMCVTILGKYSILGDKLDRIMGTVKNLLQRFMLSPKTNQHKRINYISESEIKHCLRHYFRLSDDKVTF